MTDKEKLHEIKEEIKKRIRLLDKVCSNKECETTIAYKDILKFIDSLPEEPANEDLEEEIQRAYYDKSLYDADNLDRQDFNNIARHFAEWGKTHK